MDLVKISLFRMIYSFIQTESISTDSLVVKPDF